MRRRPRVAPFVPNGPSLRAVRFFSATAWTGRLYVSTILDRGSWDSRSLVYWTEEQVDAIFNERIGDRKARTPQELRAAVLVSRIGHPAITVWIAEGLEEAARAVCVGDRII